MVADSPAASSHLYTSLRQTAATLRSNRFYSNISQAKASPIACEHRLENHSRRLMPYKENQAAQQHQEDNHPSA